MIPVRVMLVLEATAGGTARYLESVVPPLAAEGLDLHVVCCTRRDPQFGRSIERFREAGVQVSELAMVRNLSPIVDVMGVWRLRRLVRRCRPDLVHLHSSKAGGLGRLAAALGMPGFVLYTPHGFAFLDDARPLRSRWYRMLESWLARWTDVLVAVSESEGRIALAHGLAAASAIRVVPNGIDSDALACPCGAGRLSGPRTVVGSLGRMEHQKDPSRLMDLALELAKRNAPIELRVAGEGPLLETCRGRARSLELEDRVIFLGRVPDVDEFYRSIGIFVLTSRYEGLPYTVLDAMCHGLPVVAFDVPGVRDVVIPGVTGLLAGRGEVGAMAEAVLRLAADPALAERLGRAGAERVASEFRLDRQVTALAGLYRQCAALRHGLPASAAREDRVP